MLPRIPPTPVTWFLLLALIGAHSRADEIIILPPVHAASPSLLFVIRFNQTTKVVIDLQITEVPAGSNEEKFGVKKGDFVTVINGLPVAGRKLSEIEQSDGSIPMRGKVTIVRRKGLFQKNWTLNLKYVVQPQSTSGPPPTP